MPLPNTISNSSLYGAPRPKSKSTKSINLSSTSIHALSTELALARSAASATSKSAPARPRPAGSSKTNDLFKRPNKGVSKRAERDVTTSADIGGNLEDHDLARSRKRLRQKARVYDKLKRGDIVVEKDGDENENALVDFDRKWAERQQKQQNEDDGSGEGGKRKKKKNNNDDDDDDGYDDGYDDGVEVEYEDEFGRTRTGTRREADAAARARLEALDKKNAPPPEPMGVTEKPANIIWGNTIQTHAFQTPAFSTTPSADQLAAALEAAEGEEDSAETHYDASGEVRTKGVGFYGFSKDSKVRKEEMENLLRERERTEVERREKEERRNRRREELERRKEEVRNKRRGKVGEKWLAGFMGELEGGGETRGEGAVGNEGVKEP